ncbi:membrane protein [Escherichia phage Av-05]|uniref:Putative membrane protein n=1 Tax=Escherichia phage Av-05 TaxID=1527519 RepID=A0A076GCK4_9CAUD|nr:membrane protein [Escherichia phage Av-05]AII27624.1 putative membrane protein [Escherichia phage Av-05]
MKSILKVTLAVCACALVGAGITSYIKNNPDLDDYKSVEASWLSPEEKDEAISRIVQLSCDKRFREAFKPDVIVVSSGFEGRIAEQAEAYQYFDDVAIISGKQSYTGKYICTFYKNGREPYINANLDKRVQSFLK